MWALLPLAGLFAVLAAVRRLAYRRGWLAVTRLPVPVVVIGNVSVGGTGKTPLVLWLVESLRAAGYHPGVVSRGHGGRGELAEVEAGTDPARVGDEPVLLARRAGCPVWVGRRRADAARALLARHPGVDVILADDGLQHYALARDCEIAVVDAGRGLGNGLPLPAGPLREPASRLATVDAVVCHGGGRTVAGGAVPCHGMRLAGDEFVAIARPERRRAEQFRGRRLRAVAGIGHPERFFDHLRALGLDIEARAFPDHHRFVAADLPSGTVLMTEKDAVKCAPFAGEDHWMLPVSAEVEPGLLQCILDRIENAHGRQAA